MICPDAKLQSGRGGLLRRLRPASPETGRLEERARRPLLLAAGAAPRSSSSSFSTGSSPRPRRSGANGSQGGLGPPRPGGRGLLAATYAICSSERGPAGGLPDDGGRLRRRPVALPAAGLIGGEDLTFQADGSASRPVSRGAWVTGDPIAFWEVESGYPAAPSPSRPGGLPCPGVVSVPLRRPALNLEVEATRKAGSFECFTVPPRSGPRGSSFRRGRSSAGPLAGRSTRATSGRARPRPGRFRPSAPTSSSPPFRPTAAKAISAGSSIPASKKAGGRARGPGRGIPAGAAARSRGPAA